MGWLLKPADDATFFNFHGYTLLMSLPPDLPVTDVQPLPPRDKGGLLSLPVLRTLKAIVGRDPLLWSLSGAVLAFIVWASLFPLDVASYAQGQVTPEGQMKRIQHLEGGSFETSRFPRDRKWKPAQ